MPGLRNAITKTLLRLSKSAEAYPGTRTQSSKTPSAADRALQTGANLGPYRIVKHLGAGGMGSVYLALHTRLGRHVALKFLPPDLTADEQLLRRLEGEAQAASRLNHPNILTIYDIGQLEGEHYIASEYVDGATLRSALEHDAVNPATAIDVVSQVLSALVDAHAAGVIHRDLKPGNIMIRRDGYVKVIDFGLAKQIRRSSSGTTWTDSVTRLGAIIGTVDYMSPEQARGDLVDHRADLWSLGVILYETVAHRRPFEGDTENHVIVNILDQPAPSLERVADLPAGLSDVIGRALAKDPDKRYQSAREMLADLQAIQRSSKVESRVYRLVAPVTRNRKTKPIVWAGILFTSLVALGVIWWVVDGRKQFREPNWFRVGSIRRLTFNGQVLESCLSPDGKYLAFAAGDPNGLQTLYLSQLSTASEAVRVPAQAVSYIGLAFSPDDELYVVSEGNDDLKGKLYRLSLIGNSTGSPILVDIDGEISFSPKGDRFAFVRRTPRQRAGRVQNESTIFIASRDGSRTDKLISTTDWTIMRHIAWSPKGDQIAAVLFNDVGDRNSWPLLDLVDLRGAEHRLPLPNWQRVGRISWTPDANSIILPAVAHAEPPGQLQLRQVALNGHKVQDVTKELAGYSSVNLTRDGKQLAVIKEDLKVNIWISHPGDFSRGQSAMAEAERHSSLAWANENQLILNSQRNGYPNFWLFNIQSQSATGLTNEPFVEQNIITVPGSRSVVFSSNRTGQYKIWRFDPDTNNYKQLTFGPSYDETPSITPDGRWIVYTSWNSNKPHLYRVSSEGGKSSLVGQLYAKWPQISPDGKLIACLVENAADFTLALAVISFDNHLVVKTIPNAQAPFHWYKDSRVLAAVKSLDANIWAIPLKGTAPYLLTHFMDEKILDFSFSPKGNRVACLRGSPESDVNLLTRSSPK